MIGFEMEVRTSELDGIGAQVLDALRAPAREAVADSVEHVMRAISRHVPRDTGAYADSFSDDVAETPRHAEGRILSTLWEKYGRHLEFGTRHMAPRPTVIPIIEAERAWVERRLGAM